MRLLTICLAGASVLASSAALAGEDVLYGPLPAWVEPASPEDIDPDSRTPIAIYDVQQRLEGGTLHTYVDQAFRLLTPQALTQAGTSAASWLPDKGDLTVHNVTILRGDESIDVLSGGAKYTVIRREKQLEKRTLDGMLTATLAVPGLQVGDILRVTYSQTHSDPTLHGRVQLSAPLISAPVEAGFGRQVVSWPEDGAVKWQVGPGEVPVTERSKGGYKFVTVDLPLPEAEEMPGDAPFRFRRPRLIQAGTFTDWADVSRVFAPVYAPQPLEAASELAGHVARIMSESGDPLTRAALATRLVQDEISYQMNGMASGNYEPQPAAETWALRYGDCKAKTLLLLSLLAAMDIEAEPVLVHSQAGDALPDLLAMPNAFDHVLVRARIGGMAYWLDGTSAGTRLENIADTPAFDHGLAVRPQGADLETIARRLPSRPQIASTIIFDQRGGIDLPTLATMDFSLTGPLGANLSTAVAQASEEQMDEMIDRFANASFPGLRVTAGSMRYDAESAVASVHAEGILDNGWERIGARKRESFSQLPSSDINFAPDRARAAWRDIPVELGPPGRQSLTLTVRLPEGEDGYLLRGRSDLDMTFAGTRVTREAVLEGNELTVTEHVAGPGGELASENVAAEKGNAARIANASLFLVSPPDAARQWEYGRPELQKRIAPYEQAYAKAIKRDPDEASPYLARGAFRWNVGDLDGALEDYDKGLELDPDAATYANRGQLHDARGEHEKALADFRRAFELSPSADRALVLAGALGEAGETDEALALIDEFDDFGDNHGSFVQIRADVLAYGGRTQEGLDELETLLDEQPGQGWLLNSACWYRARFAPSSPGTLEACNQAVEQGGTGAAALDSRALAWLQRGEPAKALADSEAAIALVPDQIASRYIRAFALRGLGQSGKAGEGEEFIAYFSKRWPGAADDYARWGLKP